MELKVSHPGVDVDQDQIDRMERDLEKIDRRLKDYDLVYAELRLNKRDRGAPTYSVVLELEFGRNHLIAKADNPDVGAAVREAREDILRQINDRSRRGHSDFSKRA